MKYGPLIFLSALIAMSSSWFGFVLTPQMQVGQLQATNAAGSATYPAARSGLARQGADIYRQNGCAYCHSQQVGQSGTICEVILVEPGTNRAQVIKALAQVRKDISENQAAQLLDSVPQVLARLHSKADADRSVKLLVVAGAKASVGIVPVGPDIARGWGKRRTVAEDFLYDDPVMLGSQRVGPDLANVGIRIPDYNWQLRHLYAPRSEVKGSTMPPYRFLFEKRKIGRQPSPEALVMPAGFSPDEGWEIVPRLEAKALVIYLLSLRADVPLFSAPFSMAGMQPAVSGDSTNAPGTNAPAVGTTSTNAVK